MQSSGCKSLAATYGVGVSPSAVGTKTSLAPAVVSSIATCAGVVFLPPTGADTGLTLGQLALCGGIKKKTPPVQVAAGGVRTLVNVLAGARKTPSAQVAGDVHSKYK